MIATSLKSYSYAFGCPSGAVIVEAFNLAQAVRLVIVGDSQSFGRGVGGGDRLVDGAAAKCWPTLLAYFLRQMGFAASAESFFEGNNTGASWALYDPRVDPASWLIATGTTIGGRLLYANATGLGQPAITPAAEVDTFEIYYPVNTYGTLNYTIDNGAAAMAVQAGSPALGKAVATATKVGSHTLRLARNSAAGGSAYVSGVVAYNAALKDVRIINAAARGWSTVDWLVADQPWRAFPGIRGLSPQITIIMLGPNDRRVGGAGTTPAQLEANLLALINQAKADGGNVILALPMPIAQTEIATITDAEQTAIYERLARTNQLPLVRTDLILGTWEAASAAGKVGDTLHWGPQASEILAYVMARTAAQVLRRWKAA